MNRPRPREILLSRAQAKRALAPPEARWPALVACQTNVKERLGSLRVAGVGCGAVGKPASVAFAKLGVAELLLVDPKRFKAESVLTQDIGPGVVGQAKALAVAEECKAASPTTRVRAFPGRAQELPLEIWTHFDLVVMATDNLPVEVAVGQICLHLGLPLIHASILGDALVAHVRFFSNRHADGPCPRCGYGKSERALLQRQVRFSCETGISADEGIEVAAQPTRSLSYLGCLAGNLAVNQVLRFVLGLGETVEETIVEYCGYTNRVVTSKLEFNPSCGCDHTRYRVVPAKRPLAVCSLSQLAKEGLAGSGRNVAPGVGKAARAAELGFCVGNLVWAERGMCACVEPRPVRRFVGSDCNVIKRCAHCREPVGLSPFHSYRTVPAAVLGAALEIPLGRLGAASTSYVLVKSAAGVALIHENGKGEPNDPRR